jgi:hypothetical protein
MIGCGSYMTSRSAILEMKIDPDGHMSLSKRRPIMEMMGKGDRFIAY